MNSFYITLISDSSKGFYPRNTQSSFRTKLAKPIDIDKQNWEMALVEIIVPTEVKNVTEEERYFNIVTRDPQLAAEFAKLPNACEVDDKRGKKHTVRVCIPEGIYFSPKLLVKEINDAIQDAIKQVLDQRTLTFGVNFSDVSRRVKFSGNSQKKIGLEFHPNMITRLGGVENGIIYPDKDNSSFKHGVDLHMGLNQLHVYTDVAEYTLSGDVEVPILRVVPFNRRGDDLHLHVEFLNLHYVPVSRSYFDEIEINIRGDTGDPIQFTQGKSMVKLHFRRKKQ